jgi:tetraacyldisaccharide 4'-kinase
LGLAPAAVAYAGLMRARAAWGRRAAPGPLPVPTVVVGSLLAGGSGKTPVASWIARRASDLGFAPAIVMRPHTGDEAALHGQATPEIPVMTDADRRRGVRAAHRAGRDLAVLDDAFQRMDVQGDLTVGLALADAAALPAWTHPAGPWREAPDALGRADVLIVTRKRADRHASSAMAAELRRRWPGVPVGELRFVIGALRRLIDSDPVPLETLQGRRVLASAGIADPASLGALCAQLGARVQVRAWPDHHRYRQTDLDALLQIAAGVDYVVVTEKDAVKLQTRWPRNAPSPLVATLGFEWETGDDTLSNMLGRLRRGPVA